MGRWERWDKVSGPSCLCARRHGMTANPSLTMHSWVFSIQYSRAGRLKSGVIERCSGAGRSRQEVRACSGGGESVTACVGVSVEEV